MLSSNWLIWKASDLSALKAKLAPSKTSSSWPPSWLAKIIGRPVSITCAQHHLVAHIDLAAIVGRAVRRQQDFGAAFGQRLADASIVPDVLADRNAEPKPAEIDRSRHAARPRRRAFRRIRRSSADRPCRGSRGSCRRRAPRPNCGAPFALPRKADDDARAAVGGLGGKRLDRLPASRQERPASAPDLPADSRTRNSSVSSNRSAPWRAASARASRALAMFPGDVADSRVELGDGDARSVSLIVLMISQS